MTVLPGEGVVLRWSLIGIVICSAGVGVGRLKLSWVFRLGGLQNFMNSEWYEYGSLHMHMVLNIDRYILNATRLPEIFRSVDTNDTSTELHIYDLLGINTDTH